MDGGVSAEALVHAEQDARLQLGVARPRGGFIADSLEQRGGSAAATKPKPGPYTRLVGGSGCCGRQEAAGGVPRICEGFSVSSSSTPS